MMIINISNQRSKLARLVDLAMTAIAWTAFLLLLSRGLEAVMLDLHGAQPAGSELSPFRTLFQYGAIAVIDTGILFCWALYNRSRRSPGRGVKPSAPLSLQKLAESFRLNPLALLQLQASQSTIVHHDAEGHVASFKPSYVIAHGQA